MTLRPRLLVAACLAVAAASCGQGGGTGAVRAGSGDRYTGSFTVLESSDHGPQLCIHVLSSMPPQCGGLPLVGWDWDQVDNEQRVGGTRWGEWQVVGTYDGERLTLTAPPAPPRREPTEEDRDFSPACPEPEVLDPTEGVAEWEAMSQDHGVQVADVVAAWVTQPDPERGRPFVGNYVVLPGSRAEAVRRVREHYAGGLCVVERDGPTSAELADVQSELLDHAARRELGQVQVAYAEERRGVVVAKLWLVEQRHIDYVDQRWGNQVELHSLLQPVE